MLRTVFDGFKTRKPWAAAIISIALNPVLGMCYLNKGKIALAYLGFIAVAVFLIIHGKWHEIAGLDPHLLLIGPLIIAGTIHCYFTARNGGQFGPAKWYARWQILLLLLLLSGLAQLSCRTFLYEPFYIPADSMSPTIVRGNYLFVSKSAYGYSRYSGPYGSELPIKERIWTGGHLPQRGDIIIFKLPSDTSIDYIKRIVGMPGDTVQMKRGRLYINHEIVDRDFLQDKQIQINGVTRQFTEYNETLPGGVQHHIYELSDHEPLDNTDEFVIPDAHYFVLGDNRDNSADSRILGTDGKPAIIGYVPLINITGKVNGY